MRRTHILLAAAIALTAIALYLLKDRFDSPFGLPVAGNILGYPLLALGFATLLASVLSPRSLLRHRIPGAATFATLAYSLYLTHKGAFHLVHHVLLADFTEVHPYAAQPIYLIAALLIATALYLAIERPFLHLRDRHAARPD